MDAKQLWNKLVASITGKGKDAVPHAEGQHRDRLVDESDNLRRQRAMQTKVDGRGMGARQF